MFVQNTDSSNAGKDSVLTSSNITQEITEITFQNYPEHIFIEDTNSLFKGSLDNKISKRAQYGPYNLTGYSYRTLVETGKVVYQGSDLYEIGLIPGVYYIYNRYYYYKQFTIPQGSSIMWNNINYPSDTNHGWRPSNYAFGYDAVQENTQSTGDQHYAFVTMVDIVTHTLAGQAINPVMLPNSKKLKPDEFTFQYGWGTMDWG